MSPPPQAFPTTPTGERLNLCFPFTSAFSCFWSSHPLPSIFLECVFFVVRSSHEPSNRHVLLFFFLSILCHDLEVVYQYCLYGSSHTRTCSSFFLVSYHSIVVYRFTSNIPSTDHLQIDQMYHLQIIYR